MTAGKNEKMVLVATTILKELNALPKNSIKIQRIATSAGVSRAWVYKYFGQNQESIILTALDCLSPEITELSKPLDNISTKAQWIKDFLAGIEQTLDEVEVFPDIYRFYVLTLINPVQDTIYHRIKHHEDLYIQHRVVPPVMKVFSLKQDEAKKFARTIFSLRLGIILSWLQDLEKTPIHRKKILQSLENFFSEYLRH